MKNVFVIGGGTMGRGIVQVTASAGINVTIRDMDAEWTAAALAAIEKSLASTVRKGKMTEEAKTAALARIHTAETLDDAARADLVIEAIPEDLDLKRNLFSQLDAICPPGTLLATNTSALSISAIAEAAAHPERVLGIHFFNPVPAMKLVEIIKGRATSDEAIARAGEFARQIGKTPVDVKEAPGFIVNRLLVPMINEAICACEDGVASAKDIDAAMRLGAGHPMGPLALADLIGLDIVLDIMETLEKEFDDPKYRPALLLKRMVVAGKLGRKTKQGFYDYRMVNSE